MKIDLNDPKWTAYALDEISNAQERTEIERALEASPEIRELVENIRLTAGLLKEELKAEPAPHLTQVQRERIEAKADAGRNWFVRKPVWIPVCATAVVLMIISVIAIRRQYQPQGGPQQQRMMATAGRKSIPESRQQTRQITASAPQMLPRVSETVEPKDASKPVAQSENKIELAQAGTHKGPVAQPIEQASKVVEPAANGLEGAGTKTQMASSTQSTAQNLSPGSLRGKVMDPSQAVLPGATVKLTNLSNGSTLETRTNNAGEYDFVSVTPGIYTVSADVKGFQRSSKTDVKLGMRADVRLNFELPVAGTATEVEVTTSAQNLMLEAGSSVGGPANKFVQRLGGMGSGVGPYAAAPPLPVRRIPPPYPPWNRERGWRPVPQTQFNTEAYDNIRDNPFLEVTQNPLSTFSIDVDTASYSNVRRFLNEGKLPPKDAVRIEELVNYFDYDYKSPKDGKPFAANFEMTEAPWNSEHRLLRIGLKGREVNEGKRPNSNLVFLLDVSGSMMDANKLPLVKESMGLLVDNLTESDRVAIVVYASDTQVWLSSTSGDQKEKIRYAIERLSAGGSTNGASGIQLAYQTAKDNFIKGGVNRVILCTDGDFNVGITNRGDLTRLIEERAKSGIYLSALGFGMGNYKDATLEMLANKGHGNYAYIDTENEARKVLVEQINSTLVAIAKDVKIQVEFNPKYVSAYRLIGYEDRLMAKEDFNDDTKEAGVIGAGHAVTALYELVPAGMAGSKPGVDSLKYQKAPQISSSANSDEVVTVKIRSKEPEKDASVLTEFTVKNSADKFVKASQDFKFAAAVAAFGMALRDSPYKGNANLESALEWAKEGKGIDRNGYRQEFIRLVHRAFSLSF